jgi:hypothetical protein
MRMLSPTSEADVYAISCQLGLTKIGVAADARERCRALQVGSPVLLELAGSYHFRSSHDAYAIAAEVKRQLGDRHERGSWYRATPQEVRHAVANRSARQAPREAAEARQTASVAEAQAKRQRAERVRARGRGRAKVRREKLRALARLLASGSTRRAAARALGVDERTIRRWTKLPGFASELEKARERHERELERAQERERKRRERNAWRRFARLNPELWAEARNPDRRPELRPEPKPVPDPEPKRGKVLRPIHFQ